MWVDSKKASTFGYDGSDNVVHCDVVQVLYFLGSITLMMLALALPEMRTTTPSSNVFLSFIPFNIRELTT